MVCVCPWIYFRFGGPEVTSEECVSGAFPSLNLLIATAEHNSSTIHTRGSVNKHKNSGGGRSHSKWRGRGELSQRHDHVTST